MNTKQILTIGAAVALTTLVSRVNAADVEVKGHADLPKSDTKTEIRHEHDGDVNVRTDASDRAKIRHSDKASGILGMEVRNRDNQKLGEIKDLVMDVNSGKVDYAVLSVGGFLGIGEKLIALPSGALHQAQDGEYLVLDADKSKIQAAPGFAATLWPSKHDPEINRFWSDIRSTGSPAGSEIRSDTDLNRKHHVKGEVNVDTDKDHKIYTDADKDKNVHIDVNKKD
ncbi:MAG TPA: PRC-barrel domain-containing protein [Verrucomicrobiae bacterium]|jgi:sporulation protein YlmC with PRC-barrel domain|nr:PRC-barrel domain-containing protein [Verrucomicrobiae bacterium]